MFIDDSEWGWCQAGKIRVPGTGSLGGTVEVDGVGRGGYHHVGYTRPVRNKVWSGSLSVVEQPWIGAKGNGIST
jgi:hypothetical protein